MTKKLDKVKKMRENKIKKENDMHYALMVVLEKDIVKQMEKFKEADDNPESKWDNYGLGRRFRSYFSKKDGTNFCVSKVCEIDVEKMKAEMIEVAKKEYDIFKVINFESEERKREAIINMLGSYMTEDEYISQRSREFLTPYAFLHDGEWYDAKRSGSHEKWIEDFKKIFESLPPETELAVFDCHI
ncbi:hypothetical protein [Serratia sp. Se-RSBMAAmG]|uniref:hypothetical protein n=1 Tax=Serratia sp. Se-RSBMAAmG TaxID=3043305 RepID=UPI0024AF2BB8|nr:hypothetical protein [Serratia sp. Se-RSBMAAmG]MDI6975933.1 hypothetical protein [Serratia sp. Se-RSBMAAmG]